MKKRPTVKQLAFVKLSGHGIPLSYTKRDNTASRVDPNTVYGDPSVLPRAKKKKQKSNEEKRNEYLGYPKPHKGRKIA